MRIETEQSRHGLGGGSPVQRAVVLGGSFAGLMAARVLSDYAEDVVIVEPDCLDDASRTGVPHRRQLHALLAMGHTQLERWFPGITKEMTTQGALVGRGEAVQFYVDGHRRLPLEEVEMLGATRPFIERAVRLRTRGLPNVRIIAGRGQGLLIQGKCVRGVRYIPNGQQTETTTLTADFVVDAMGRSSRLSAWLEQEGWPVPPLDRMTIDLGYATASFRRGSELPGTVIAHSAPGPASDYQPTLCEPGALAAVEDSRWTVVLAGYAGHRPSRDPQEFRSRMRRCVQPLREVAEQCELESDVETFHFRESRRRRFLAASRLPGGLAAVGDAVASINPIYGQGLTLAALQASALAAYLRSGAAAHEPAWGYFQRADVFVNAGWNLSTTADLAQPHVIGPYPRGYALMRWVGDKITQASLQDAEINRAYMSVVHMQQHPRALARPRVLMRAARVLLAR
ncbi:FAD-dependent monooxygenase [Streptomyces sp. NPDC004658]|uniref:FAD-dependent monooxygenase n=1 Tax=Streptomyces sp. NPDC004658 TaxID=3154672 RepID=UPI00339E49ED